jgi:hypothetical protein
MKKNLLLLFSLLSIAVFAGIVTQPARAADKEKPALEAKAKISKDEAKKIALAKVPKGKIKEGELEEEGGKLIWSFDIKTKGSKELTEVHVDAMTGEVVSVEKESRAAEKKEKQEKKEKEKK